MSTVKKVPQRQCIGCGEMKNKRELIRVLKGTDDVISIDATGRKNGRGAYICPSMACFEKAVKSRGLERSFKMAIPKEVYESLKKEMERKSRAGDRVGRIFGQHEENVPEYVYLL